MTIKQINLDTIAVLIALLAVFVPLILACAAPELATQLNR